MPLETMVAVGAIWPDDFGRCNAGGTISPGLWGTMATCVMCVCRTVSFGSLNLDIRLSRVRPARNRSKLHARLDWILQGHDTGAEGCHGTRSLQYLACDNPPLPIRNHSIRPIDPGTDRRTLQFHRTCTKEIRKTKFNNSNPMNLPSLWAYILSLTGWVSPSLDPDLPPLTLPLPTAVPEAA